MASRLLMPTPEDLVDAFVTLPTEGILALANAFSHSAPNIMSDRAIAEERAYAIRRDTPTRGVVRAAGDRARDYGRAEVSDDEWGRAEIMLHYALVAVTTRDLIDERSYSHLIMPWAMAVASLWDEEAA
jgi:hypothetical protein